MPKVTLDVWDGTKMDAYVARPGTSANSGQKDGEPARRRMIVAEWFKRRDAPSEMHRSFVGLKPCPGRQINTHGDRRDADVSVAPLVAGETPASRSERL